MKHKKNVIFLCILLFVISALVGVGIWQRENVRAVAMILTTDSDAISDHWIAQQDMQRKFLEDHHITVKIPTPQQNEDLLDGRVSAAEVKQAQGLPSTPEAFFPDFQASTEDSSSGQSGSIAQADGAVEELSPPNRAEELLTACTQSLYGYRVELFEQLGVLKSEALAQWSSLPEEERTKLRKLDIALDGLSKCYSLEAELDAKVKALLDSYRKELEALGADTEMIDQLWQQYCEDKQATKTYYLDQYL